MIHKTIKHVLLTVRTKRMSSYGRTGYLILTKRGNFDSAPQNLRERWDSDTKLSFRTLSISYHSTFNTMPARLLLRYLVKEIYLTFVLWRIFQKLKYKRK